MNKIIFISCILALSLPGNVFSAESKECYEKALSQTEINQCAAQSLQEAEAELNRVYEKIKEVYIEDKTFLEKLEKAQFAWTKSKEADFELKFPHIDEPRFYGSVFSMCSTEYKAKLTLQRVDFLKHWTTGSESGDICRGSQVPQSYLKEILANESKK